MSGLCQDVGFDCHRGNRSSSPCGAAMPRAAGLQSLKNLKRKPGSDSIHAVESSQNLLNRSHSRCGTHAGSATVSVNAARTLGLHYFLA